MPNWIDICDWIDCEELGYPPKSSGGNGGEADSADPYLLVGAAEAGKIGFDEIKKIAEMFSKENDFEKANVLYSSLPKVAAINGNIPALKVSSAMIDYARFLDRNDKPFEAGAMFNMSILNIDSNLNH